MCRITCDAAVAGRMEASERSRPVRASAGSSRSRKPPSAAAAGSKEPPPARCPSVATAAHVAAKLAARTHLTTDNGP
ncbi:hypothetical protein AB0I81_00170 [Nonomuraea sp. NPDC050404]|uniref:hypothetical protein n=1 Tax=Nonomuraea sp. NPDC050404 TaxID=3155783 RepID=UPI00340BF205